MKYLDLNTLPARLLHGTWKTMELFPGSNPGDSFFLYTSTLILQPNGTFNSLNGREVTGKWEMFRETEIIYNPQLNFFTDQPEPQNAIITRFREDSKNETTIYQMTIYFDSGLELVLERTTS